MSAVLALRPREPAMTVQQRQWAVVEVTLVALPTAISLAGLFASHTMRRWGLRPLADVAERVTAALVTRAVDTIGVAQPRPTWNETAELHLIGVRLHRTERHVIIAVSITDPTPPDPTEAAPVLPVGVRWGHVRPRGGGTTIWVELAIPTPAGRLPKRPTRYYPPPAQPSEPMRDVRLLRRVLDGLHRLDTDDSEGSR